MSVPDAAPRPGPGQGVNVVVLGGGQVQILGGKVLFDRGRGLVVEAARPPEGGWVKGERLILLFTVGEAVWLLRGRVAEALTGTRCYLLPNGSPVEMEKREYIRATLTVPAAIETAMPGAGTAPLEPSVVELSASGFRWNGAADVAQGGKVVLRLRDDAEAGRVIVAPADVVRVVRGDAAAEVAGRFTTIGAEDRDAILRMVFRARHRELGLEDEPVP
jgi:hypothetical protein